jgi:hypothetical protein
MHAEVFGATCSAFNVLCVLLALAVGLNPLYLKADIVAAAAATAPGCVTLLVLQLLPQVFVR